MKKIFIASTNPVKIGSTKKAFEEMFPHEIYSFEGVNAPSGVSDQPMSEEETIQGAMNRVQHLKKAHPIARFWVGIEGGLKEVKQEMEAFAWVIVEGPDGRVGKGRSGSFFLPHEVASLIRAGKELGEADDIVFGKTNSKQSTGSVGILTGDVITRTTFYIPAVILALIPFKNPKLFA